MSIRSVLLAAALGVAMISGSVSAQDQNQGGQGQNRQDGERRRGNWDPAQMQQQMMERMKEQLKAPDDEWKVIEPKLSKVMTASRDLRMGGFGGRGGMGGGGRGGDNNEPQTEVAKASRELRTAIQNDGASASEIEAKLAAFRAAREKAQEELKAAREDLKSVLTQRQEAVLVMMGMLE